MLPPNPWTGRNSSTLDNVQDISLHYKVHTDSAWLLIHALTKLSTKKVKEPDLKTKHLLLYSCKFIYYPNRFTMSFNFFNFITTTCISTVCYLNRYMTRTATSQETVSLCHVATNHTNFSACTDSITYVP